uniref:BPH_2 domain-containing protein n=1 Tax=Mesocestoides corti TaxID=53468 RepID=A0A5K3EXV4_MESCO
MVCISSSMNDNVVVTIKYGAYEACGIVIYRTHRLEGLQNLLESEGHSVILSEIPYVRDIMEIWVRGEMIYRSEITELQFGGDGILDKKANEIVQRIREAC